MSEKSMNVGARSLPMGDGDVAEVQALSDLFPPLCFSFHHKCTEVVASHTLSGGPSTEIRMRSSRWFSLRQLCRSVFMSLRMEKVRSTCPLAIGMQKRS